MPNAAFTPRNVAKFVVKSVVAGKASQITQHAMVDYTQFEEDDRIVSITGTVVGWYVSDKLKPYTDSAVDKTFDFVNARKEARQARRNAAETETKD